MYLNRCPSHGRARVAVGQVELVLIALLFFNIGQVGNLKLTKLGAQGGKLLGVAAQNYVRTARQPRHFYLRSVGL